MIYIWLFYLDEENISHLVDWTMCKKLSTLNSVFYSWLLLYQSQNPVWVPDITDIYIFTLHMYDIMGLIVIVIC